MPITINGQINATVQPGLPLQAAITQLGLVPRVVVAELNRQIIPGEVFATTVLKDGDTLELLSFVGGG